MDNNLPPPAQHGPPQAPAPSQMFMPSSSVHPPDNLIQFGAGPPQNRGMKRMWLVLCGVVLVVIIAAVLLLALYVVPAQKSEEFTTKSQAILTDLSKEVKDLHDNNFVETKNTPTDYDEAKAVLQEHINDLETTQQKTRALKDRYDALEPTSRDKLLVEKMKKAFTLSQGIEKKYAASLDVRDKTFEAYGELPNDLTAYVAKYYAGGYRSEFITQTDEIQRSAQDSLIKMKNMEKPSNDDMPYYDYRVDFLADVDKTFGALNEDYRTSQFDSVNSEITAFSNTNTARSETVIKVLNAYVDDSSIAKDFTAFTELTKTK